MITELLHVPHLCRDEQVAPGSKPSVVGATSDAGVAPYVAAVAALAAFSGAGAFFTAGLGPAFLATAFLRSAHLFRWAAAIFLRASALMVRFGAAGFASALAAAHRFLCAAAMRCRAAALNVRRGPWPGATATTLAPEPSRRRMSAIFSSTFFLICSNPVNAASSSDASTANPLRRPGMK